MAKTNRFHFRLDDEMKQQLEQLAAKLKMDVAVYVRHIIQQEILKENNHKDNE